MRTLSHPMYIVTHGSQEHESTATALWDNAFGPFRRKSLETKESVPWSLLAPEISNVFKRITGRGLDESHLDFLKQRFFKKNVPDSEKIDRKGFIKNINMPNPILVMKNGKPEKKDCPVFKWIFELMQMLKNDNGNLSRI